MTIMYTDNQTFSRNCFALLILLPLLSLVGGLNEDVVVDEDVPYLERALMAPRLGGMRKGKDIAAPNAAMSPKDAKLSQYIEALHELKKHVEDNSDYVGDKFPEEARKIHYGETEARSIHGEATSEEADELNEEGVDFQRIPWPGKPDA